MYSKIIQYAIYLENDDASTVLYIYTALLVKQACYNFTRQFYLQSTSFTHKYVENGLNAKRLLYVQYFADIMFFVYTKPPSPTFYSMVINWSNDYK